MLTLNIIYEVLPDRIVTIKLPETVCPGRHELVIVLEENTIDENAMIREDVLAENRRRPSPKLKGTRILGDIMSPAVPETDWEGASVLPVKPTSKKYTAKELNALCDLNAPIPEDLMDAKL